MGLLLLGLIGPTHALAAGRDERARVVPSTLHDRALAEGEVRVLVELALPSGRLAEGALTTQERAAYRQEIIDTASRVLSRLSKHPHRVLRRYVASPMIALQAGPGALQELDAAGFMVKRVVEDRIHRPVLLDSVPLVGADQAWAQGFDGTGRVVAVIDSGVDSSHPFLAGKVVEEACYSTTSGLQSTTLCPNGGQEQIGPGAGMNCPLELEGCWHGTHVAGIAAGSGTPDLPVTGVGKGANIMAVQVFSRINGFFDCGGAPPCLGAFTSDILAALERVYTLRTTHAFAAVNMSLGGGLFSSACDGEPYKPFIDNLRAVGIATIVASGNSGATDQISAPACVSTAVSVGATTKDDQVADFSNVSPFLSLFAPGDGILSLYPGENLAVASGTSMATPHVAGAWAILKQADPAASVDQVLTALTATGVMITDSRAGTGTTRPRIQVDLALSSLLHPGMPLVASVMPDRGTVGTTLTVTIRGVSFEPGASVTFGAGVTVNATTVTSSSQIAADVTIALMAAGGPRDVTVTNPDGQSSTRPAAFTVMLPPPTMSLAFVGKVRDRVGPANAGFGADGALDGSFRVTVNGGIWPRTVTRMELRGSGGIWDGDAATPAWALGSAGSLDGPLLNGTDGRLNVGVSDGGVLFVFGSDFSPGAFTGGASFTVIASFVDGTTASTTVTLPPVLTITSVTPNTGVPGTSLTATVAGTNFQPGASVSFGAGVVVTSTTIASPSQLSAAIAIAADATMGPRDVTVTSPDGQMAIRAGGFAIAPPPPTMSLAFVGKARDRVGQANAGFGADGAFDGSFRVTVNGGVWPRTVTRVELRGSVGIWDSDTASPSWALGAALSLDGALLNAADGSVNFGVSDGGVFFVFGSDFSPSAFNTGASFTLIAKFADGTTASASTTLPPVPTVTSVSPSSGTPGASLAVTVAGANFQSGASIAFGAGIAVISTTVSSPSQLSAAIAIAAGAAMGPRDVTVTNPDGQLAIRAAGFAVAPPPPTLSLAFLGKARDKVGGANAAFSADGALDGTFRVTIEAGSGARTVTRVELQRAAGGLWDSDTASPSWALGVAASLDGALLNAANGTVNFGVAEGGSFVLFAADGGNWFASGNGFTATVSLADGSTASASVTVPPVPTVTSVTPSSAMPGANLTVTVAGTNFQTGATASFGAGITVSSTTVASASQLTAAIAIASGAAMGPRDVTVTNPNAQVGTLTGGFAVAPPPPTLGLAFLGKARDKVGGANAAFGADGALDGTFRVTIQAGSGSRTVTRLVLRRSTGETWDTDSATVSWALGAAASLDGALLNAANGTVSIAVPDGGAFFVFAADSGGTSFAGGSAFTLTANFADASTASVNLTLPPVPTITSVTPSSGTPGASLTVTVAGTNFQTGATASFGAGITVSSTTVTSASQLTAAIAIASAAVMGPRDVTVTNPDGQSAVRTAGFSVSPPAPTISLVFQGKIRDKVGGGNAAFSADGSLDGTFRVTIEPGSGARTVTRVQLQRAAGGLWDSDTATPSWALGAATSLDGAVLNAANGAVNFGVSEGGAFYVFAADGGSWFASGNGFTVTASFADGTTASASTTVPPSPTIASVTPSSGVPGASLTVTVVGTNFQAGASVSFGAGVTITSMAVSPTQISAAITIAAAAAMGPRAVTVTNPDGQMVVRMGGFAVAPPPPTLSLAFLGKLRDRVGGGNAAFSADGTQDATFRVTIEPGSGARTVTRVQLQRAAGGLWDSDTATPSWALGAAASLDGALLNAANGTVNFAVAEAGAFYVFAADGGAWFTTGNAFTVTANFADGSAASASVTVPPMPGITSVTPSSATPGASLTVTAVGTNFQTGASLSFGAGITLTSPPVVSPTQISAAITIASEAVMGSRDVTVTNPDGQSAIRPGGFSVSPPPPTMSLIFEGKIRDKVGGANAAFSADGALDATFRATIEPGSGPRTVIRVELRRAAGGLWDSDTATPSWALGAATSLDGALLNAANGTVNFGVAEGGSFYVFAADGGAWFVSGNGFSLTVTLADGSMVTVSTTVP